MLDLHMQITINQLKKYMYNEISPVYVLTEYICIVLSIFHSRKMWQIQIITRFGQLQGIFGVQSSVEVCEQFTNDILFAWGWLVIIPNL
jgi:hypothetical protein